LRAREPVFDLAERLQELVEPLLVGPAQVAAQRARILEQEIDSATARSDGPLARRTVPLCRRLEQALEDSTRRRLSGDGAALGVEGDRGRSTFGTDAPLTRQHQRMNAGL